MYVSLLILMYGNLIVVPLSILLRSVICFTSLKSVSTGNTITCANNSSYPMKGVGKIVLIVTNGSSFTLVNALYVPRIKKNLLLVSTLTRIGLVVKFVDDKCMVHDLNYVKVSLCQGFHKLNAHRKCVEDFACAILDMQAVSDAKLWHAHFGHLNFASLMHI